MLKIAINGFGRIGRVLERVNLKQNLFKLVAINDINSDIHNLVYLLKYDTTYGKLEKDINVVSKNVIDIHGSQMNVFHCENIQEIPWYDMGIDLIIDASGVKENYKKITIYANKFKHYVATTDLGNKAKNIICGVNENTLNFKSDKYLAGSTCDAAALSPIIKVILSNYEISHGFLTTLHPWLSYQKLMDSSKISGMQDADAYGLGRSSLTSLIPKSTSAVSATNYITPGIINKIESFSYRVPTATVSSAVLNLTLTTDTTIEKLHQLFSSFEQNQLYKGMYLNKEHLVSIDYSGFDYSCIIDLRWTKIINNRNIQIVYWYDNEWSYCCRLADLIHFITSWYESDIAKHNAFFENKVPTNV